MTLMQAFLLLSFCFAPVLSTASPEDDKHDGGLRHRELQSGSLEPYCFQKRSDLEDAISSGFGIGLIKPNTRSSPTYMDQSKSGVLVMP